MTSIVLWSDLDRYSAKRKNPNVSNALSNNYVLLANMRKCFDVEIG
jgi:hypothetical protein